MGALIPDIRPAIARELSARFLSRQAKKPPEENHHHRVTTDRFTTDAGRLGILGAEVGVGGQISHTYTPPPRTSITSQCSEVTLMSCTNQQKGLTEEVIKSYTRHRKRTGGEMGPYSNRLTILTSSGLTTSTDIVESRERK
jgi:hypothetical protein